MYAKSILRCLFLLSLTIYSAQLKAQTKTNPITIDGLDADWTGKVFTVDSVNGFEIASSKVDDHLFLIIRFIHKTAQIKSLATGMQVGFDMYQKNKSQQYIYFPLDNSSKVNPTEHLRDLNTMQYSLLMLTTEYELKKFTNGNGRYQKDAENPIGIKLALGINEEEKLFYEYSIPLETLRNKKDPADLTSNQIEIEIYIPAINIPAPSTSTGGETGSFNSRYGVTPTSKQNKAGSRPSAPSSNNDLKNQFKEMFESTKKKVKISF